VFGNDIATLPDFPAEIRAPAGTVAGVSGFQINFAATEIHTPGDEVDALIAMNPAAFKANVADVELGRHRRGQRKRIQQDQPSQGRLPRRVQPDRRRGAQRQVQDLRRCPSRG
jgi:hypothetical protein